MATDASKPAEQTLFVRKASGLVKGWSGGDGFRYSFFSVNLFLAIWSFAYATFIPGGSLFWSIVITAIFIVLEIIVYAGLISAMPRAGGDYVWMTRIFNSADRLRHRRRGLVVHPLALDPDLRRHGRADHGQADLPHPRPQRRGRLAGQPHRHLRRLARGHRHRLDPGRRRHEDLRQVPEVGHVDRPRRRASSAASCCSSRPATRSRRSSTRPPTSTTAATTARSTSRSTRPTRPAYFVYDDERLPSSPSRARPIPARSRPIEAIGAGTGMPTSTFTGGLELGHLDAHPVHDVLDGVAELGRDPLRRGPRGQGLPQEHLPDARRAARADRHRPRLPGLDDLEGGLPGLHGHDGVVRSTRVGASRRSAATTSRRRR